MNPNEKPGTSEFLEITAAAAGGKHPKVSGVAYGGGIWGLLLKNRRINTKLFKLTINLSFGNLYVLL